MKKLIVQDTLVSLTRVNDDDYISLTDIARVRNPDEPKNVAKNWLRNRSTVESLLIRPDEVLSFFRRGRDHALQIQGEQLIHHRAGAIGLWERINNAAFKEVEFDSFKLQAGFNSFYLGANAAGKLK